MGVSPNFTAVKPHLISHNHISAPVIFLIALIFLSGCVSPDKETGQADYFSIKAYIDQEVVRLDSAYGHLVKTATINEQTEVDTVQVHDWKTELKAFIETDISKPALRGKYIVSDSTLADGASVTTYRAKSEKEDTQSLRVFRQDEKIARLRIQARSKNFIYSSAHTLTYDPARGFSIKARQEVVLGSEEHFSMEVRFLE